MAYRRSSAQPRPALGPTRRDDGTTRPGAHAQPEAMGLRAPAVVGLEGALAHSRLQGSIAGNLVAAGRPPAAGLIESPNELRRRTPRMRQGGRGHAATTADDSAGLRYASEPPRVKPATIGKRGYAARCGKVGCPNLLPATGMPASARDQRRATAAGLGDRCATSQRPSRLVARRPGSERRMRGVCEPAE